MPETTPDSNVLLEDLDFVPRQQSSYDDSQYSNSFFTSLEDLGAKPKTIDDLKTELSDQENPKAPVVKCAAPEKLSQAESAAMVQMQYHQLLKEKHEKEISKGFFGALFITICGVICSVLMVVLGKFSLIHIGCIVLISALFLVRIRFVKCISYIVYIANTLYMSFVLYKEISAAHTSSFILTVAAIACAIISNILICYKLFSNDKIETYYASVNDDESLIA